MKLLKNGLLLTMCDEPYIGDIAIENGRIVDIGRNLSIENGEVIDATNCYIMPGIIDAHSHIGLQLSGTRENEVNELNESICPEMRAIDAINPQDIAFMEARSLGITTCITGPGSINLIGGSFAAIKTVGNTVEDMLIKEPVAMKAALGENPKFRYTEINKTPKTRLASAAIIRRALAAAVDYDKKVKSYEDDPELIMIRDLSLEALLPVVRGELPLKIHVHRADDINTAIRIAEEFNLCYTLEHCSEGYLIPERLLSALRKGCKGIIIGPLMSRNSKVECRNKLNIKFPKRLYDSNIDFAISTDFPVMTLTSAMPQVALSVAEGLPEDVAFKSITINAAKIIGIDDRVGSLEKGKDADIAVFSGHPMDYRSLCIMTFIDGELVYERI